MFIKCFFLFLKLFWAYLASKLEKSAKRAKFLKFSRDIKTRKFFDWVQNCWQVAKNSPKKWLTKKVKKNEFWARNFCWKFFNGFQPGINFCVWNCCRKSFFPSLLFFVTLKLNTPDETPKRETPVTIVS